MPCGSDEAEEYLEECVKQRVRVGAELVMKFPYDQEVQIVMNKVPFSIRLAEKCHQVQGEIVTYLP